MPPSSISKAMRMASSAAASVAWAASATCSLPPQAGHIPYGKAKPSLTLEQSWHFQESAAVAQQTYSSSPSMGRWHLGQALPAAVEVGIWAPVATAPPPCPRGVGGTKTIMSASVMRHLVLPLFR